VTERYCNVLNPRDAGTQTTPCGRPVDIDPLSREDAW
jgi:hypothetical protein